MRVRTEPWTRLQRVVALVAVVWAAALVLGAAPPAGALATGDVRLGTWVGEVHAVGEGASYEYTGSACPVEDEVCIEILATYRIVPVTPEAGAALAAAAGGQAAMTGVLLPGDGGLMGTLVVWEVAEP
ncbi:MAG: hypothetical protein ACRDKW_14450 [Actinomycetota bacterium]